jgi:hypothetical protein
MNHFGLSLIVGLLLLPLGCGGNEGPGANDGPTGPVITTLVVTTTSLPNAAPTVAYSQTLAATGGDGSYTWSLTVGSLPPGLTLNSSTGAITGTPTGASSTFTLQVASGDGQTDTGALTITVNATLTVGTMTLPDGGVGLVYGTQTLAATGGDGTYTWTVSTGSLPSGLTLAASRDITGTPTATGTSDFTVQVTSGDAQTATQQLAIIVTTLSPPFSGTIFLDPDIILPSDPTTFQSLSSAGQGSRLMFDRRVDAFITLDAYLFNATFDDGLDTEIQVNPEFGSTAALAEAQKYAEVIGRLPTALRNDVQFVWIHKGVQPFGGGNNSLLIHTDQADLYAADGILEETFVHEAAHTSLDATHASAPAWLDAQSADGVFISSYARDFPIREDIAESFLLYMAIRYRSGRITTVLKDMILLTMPNRIAYFDSQSIDVYPIN